MLIIKKKYKHHADFLEMGLIKQHSFLMYIYLLGKYKLSVLRILITGSDLLSKTKLISNCRLRKSVTAKLAGSSEWEEKEYLINCVALNKK